MTVIAALQKNGIIYIGADSAGVNDAGELTLHLDAKVFFLQSSLPMLVGCTASFRFMNILEHWFQAPEYDGMMPFQRYLVTLFVDALRETLKSKGYGLKGDEGEENGGTFLLGCTYGLYKISVDFQVLRTFKPFLTTGSGGSEARGALYATEGLDLPPEERLMLALKASEYYCQSIRGPFIIKKIECKSEVENDGSIL